jgi:hypothetical protein
VESKQVTAVAIVAGGALVIYAGVTGYHLDDALRVIAGKEPKQAPRSWFGVRKGLATPGSKTGASPLGYEWKNGYLESLDTSKFPAIDHNSPDYQTGSNGQRHIRVGGFDYYDPQNSPDYIPPPQGEGRNPDGSISTTAANANNYGVVNI